MHYADGQEIHLGDRVAIGWTTSFSGVVVACIGRNEYTPAYPQEAWGYLGQGILVDTDFAGLVHYSENVEELRLVARVDVEGLT